MSILFLVSTQALAEGLTSVGTISYLAIETSIITIQLEDANNNIIKADPDGCGRDWAFILDKNHPRNNTLSAALMSAYHVKAPLKFKLVDCAYLFPKVEYVMYGDYKP